VIASIFPWTWRNFFNFSWLVKRQNIFTWKHIVKGYRGPRETVAAEKNCQNTCGCWMLHYNCYKTIFIRRFIRSIFYSITKVNEFYKSTFRVGYIIAFAQTKMARQKLSYFKIANLHMNKNKLCCSSLFRLYICFRWYSMYIWENIKNIYIYINQIKDKFLSHIAIFYGNF
jgi:hypothetical protein